jgi:hypothetical protein
MVLLSISGIVLIYYAVTESEHLGSDVTTSMVPFAFTAISTSIVLLLCGLFQPDLYKPFARCSYNVTDDPRSENDEITNNKNNQETDENDPMSNSWFCCSSPQTTPLTNYDEIE